MRDLRFVFWSDSSDWHDYYSQVVSARRLSRFKWEIRYFTVTGTQEIIVSADHAWCEIVDL